MATFYILDEKKRPRPVTDGSAWAAWIEQHEAETRVAEEEIGNAVVSTIFSGMTEAMLWETVATDAKGTFWETANCTGNWE